jgi:hypothetical protein
MRAMETTELDRMARRLSTLEKQLAEFQMKAEPTRAEWGNAAR